MNEVKEETKQKVPPTNQFSLRMNQPKTQRQQYIQNIADDPMQCIQTLNPELSNQESQPRRKKGRPQKEKMASFPSQNANFLQNIGNIAPIDRNLHISTMPKQPLIAMSRPVTQSVSVETQQAAFAPINAPNRQIDEFDDLTRLQLTFEDDSVTKFVSLPGNSECQICQDDGDLIICDQCPIAFHEGCLEGKEYIRNENQFLCINCTNPNQKSLKECIECLEKCSLLTDCEDIVEPEFLKKLSLVQCTLCKNKIHYKCLQKPLWLIFMAHLERSKAMGQEDQKLTFVPEYKFDESDDIFEVSIKISNIFQEKLKNAKNYDQILELIKIIQSLSFQPDKEPLLNSVCELCIRSREVDEFLDYYDPKSEQSTSSLHLNFDSEFSQELKERSFYKVKLKDTSNLHLVWIDFKEAIEFKKLFHFFKRLQQEKESGASALIQENIFEVRNSMLQEFIIPQSILGVTNFQNCSYHQTENKSRQNSKISLWKNVLIKWQGKEIEESTWESVEYIECCKNDNFDSQIQTNFQSALQKCILAYEQIKNERFCAQYDLEYRKALVRGRSQALQLVGDFNLIYKRQGLACLKKAQEQGLTMMEHQIQGVTWLLQSWNSKTSVMLADEMGLGKTIQALSFIRELIVTYRITRPFLITVPLSTLGNWVKECQLWCPEAKVLCYHGSAESRKMSRSMEFFHNLSSLNDLKFRAPKFNILLVPFDTLRQDFKHLVQIEWQAFIVDEGQKMKNNESKFFKKCHTIQTPFRLLLSGTPMQNCVEELFCMLEFLDPNKFGVNFRDHLAKIKEQSQSLLQGETNQGSVEASEVQRKQQSQFFCELQTQLKPHLLRRFKRDVLKDFPLRKEVIVRIEMTQAQLDLSKFLIDQNINVLVDIEKSQKNLKNNVNMCRVNNLLMTLRQVANSTLALGEAYGSQNISRQHLCRQINIPDPESLADFLASSSKLHYVSQILDEILKDHKVLIFSQFIGMLNLTADFLAFKGIRSLKIDGSTSNAKRKQMIDNFDLPEFKVFLLSTKAGGLGLNLTQADTVIILDSDFNPHNDQQALSRAHRIGQKNDVLVYRFVSKNSVEERVLEAAKKKLMLDTAVQQKNQSMVLKVLEFGAKKLFQSTNKEKQDVNDQQMELQKENKEKNTEFAGDQKIRREYQVDQENLNSLLDRKTQFANLLEERKLEENKSECVDQGIFDYLSQFKVAEFENKGRILKKGEKDEMKLRLPGQQKNDWFSDDEDQQEGSDEQNGDFFTSMANKRQRMIQERNQKENADKNAALDLSDHSDKSSQMDIDSDSQNRNSENSYHPIDSELSGNIKAQQNDPNSQEERKKSTHYSNSKVENFAGDAMLIDDANVQFHNFPNQILQSQTIKENQESQIYSLKKQIYRFLKEFDEFPNYYSPAIYLDLTQELDSYEIVLRIHGLDNNQIKDFVQAFMLFGIQNRDYLTLYEKIQGQINSNIWFKPLDMEFLSLRFVDVDTFQNFASIWSDIQISMITAAEKRPDLEMNTQSFKIFGNNSLNDLTMRSYKLFLLDQFVRETQTQKFSQLQPDFNENQMKTNLKPWVSLCDIILANLTLEFGYGKYEIFSGHPIWNIVYARITPSQNELQNLTVYETLKCLQELEIRRLDLIKIPKDGHFGLGMILLNCDIQRVLYQINQPLNCEAKQKHGTILNAFKREIQEHLKDKFTLLINKLRDERKYQYSQ